MNLSRRRIGVIGAGFTGATLAVRLAEHPDPAEIFLFDRSGTFGEGIAYATTNERHLLNVPAGNMSALDGDPAHFLRWLDEMGYPAAANSFLRRGLYGAYLKDVLGRCHRITRINAEVRHLDLDADGIVLRPFRGRSLRVDQAVLCVGNFPPASPVERRMERSCRPRYVANPWDAHDLDAIGIDEAVVMVGSGLTMIDVVLDLDSRGHRGPLIALSRHGLLPAAHRPAASLHASIAWQEVPASTRALLRAVRLAVVDETRRGGDWRSVIDSLRPHTQALWRALPVPERRRFLRHLKPYWEIHRHRLAPEIAGRIERLQREGRLRLMAGRVREVIAGPQGVQLRVRERGGKAVHRIDAGWIVNCSGPALDYEHVADPLMRSLFKSGLVRPGPLSLGLDVDDDYRVIDAAGVPSARLFALGPPLRGVLWETTAVPDIRRQCAALADALNLAGVSSARHECI